MTLSSLLCVLFGHERLVQCFFTNRCLYGGQFIIGALFAGLINTGVNAAWILCFLGQNEHWQGKVRQEINTAIMERRLSEHESAADTLSRFTIDDWEKSFPTVDLCLRESIRLTMPGSMIRKNIGGKNIDILGSNEIIPKDAFAV